MKKLIAVATLVVSFSSVNAFAKTATCQVDDSGVTLYKGACTFTPQGGGSFYISGKALNRSVGVAGIMVYIEQPNFAVVQGTKPQGGASTWGEAVRSSTQKACWVGVQSDFKICAW